MNAEPVLDRPKKYSIYKPNKKISGAAMQFDLNPARESVFVEASSQRGEHEFDWVNKIVFKLAASDISKILVVLEGRKPSIDLYHETGKSPFVQEQIVKNKALNVSKADYGFFFKLSQQKMDGSVSAVNISVSEDEAIALRVLFQEALKKIFKW